MRFKPTIKGMITLLLGLVFVVITIMAASAVSEFSISGFSEWDNSVLNTFSANITGYPYLTPYTAAEYLFEWNTNDSIGSNDGTLNGYTLNDGTISGATTGVSGVYGEGVSFDGNDYIDFGTITGATFTDAISWTHWVNVNDLTANDNRFLDISDDIKSLSTANKFWCQIKDESLSNKFTSYTNAGLTGWHHVACVGNTSDGSVTMYIDGVQRGTPGTGLSTITNRSLGNKLGSGYNGAANFFNGSLDEVRIYNFAMTSSQVQADMNSYYPVETPLLSYSFEAYNATHVFDTNWNVQSQDEAETGAISFDGTDDKLTLSSSITPTTGGTLSLWVYNNEDASQYAYAATSDGGIFYGTRSTDGGVYAVFDGGWKTFPLQYSIGVWEHVTYVYNTTHYNLYVNGSFISGVASTTPITIGQLGYRTGLIFNGSLSEVQIFDRALTSDEVTYLYDNRKVTYELTTSDGTLETQIPNSSPNQYNITVATTDYFPQSFTNHAVSSNLSVFFNQSVITFDSFEKFTGDQLSSTYHLINKSGTPFQEGADVITGTDVGTTDSIGIKFTPTKDYLRVYSVTVDSGESGSTRARLFDSDYNLIASTTTRSGDDYIFDDDTLLTKDASYTIEIDDDGGTYTAGREAAYAGYPEVYASHTITSGSNGNLTDTNDKYNINYINFTLPETISENDIINIKAANSYSLYANTSGYYNKTITFSVAAFDNKTVNVTNIFDTYLNVSAKDSFNNNSINNFNLSITSSIFNQSYEVTNYELIEALKGYSYTASAISTSNFLLGTDTKTPTTNLELWVLFLDPYNSVNITFREYDDTIINTTTINITIIDGTTATNYNTTNGTLQLRLLTPNDYELRTTASGYNDRKYYFTVTNDSTQNIIIYLEENVSTELQQIRILDTTNTEVTGAIVRVEKETTLGSNLWSNYAEETTNAEGIANTYLEKGINNYYRFAVFVEGAVIPIYPSGADYTVKTNFIAGVSEVVDIVINLQAVEITDYYEELYSVSTNIGFVNNDTVWFSWVDAQNTISGAKLVIRGKYIDNTTAYELINTQTSSATSGNITYTFTPINNTIYQAYGYIIYSDRESLAQTATKSYGVTSFVEKNTGLLLAVLILAVTAFLTVSFGVLLSGVMTVLMLVFTNIIGLTNFPTTIITSLLALFIILLIRITKGDEG